jgi:hypothetical protein
VVIVHFETNQKLKQRLNTQYSYGFVLCKILAFASNKNRDGEVLVLVHGCEYWLDATQCQNDSVLLEHWKLAYHNVSSKLPAQGRGVNFDGGTISNQKD